MRRFVVAAVLIGASPAQSQSTPETAPPKLAAQPVTETYFGTPVEDRFRFVEKMEPATIAWMRAQAAATRAALDAIPPRAAAEARMSAFGGAFGFVRSPERAGNRLFFLQRAPGVDQYSLAMREGATTRLLVDVPALIRAKGYPVSVDGFEPSRDGRFVALRMSEKGSENSTLTILDVATGKTIAGPERMGPFTGTSWDEDGKSLFFTRMPDPATVTTPTDQYKNSEVLYWRFGTPPQVVGGARHATSPDRDPMHFPFVITPRGTDRAFLIEADGVSNEVEVWEAPRRDAAAGTARWRKVIARDDAVTQFHVAPDGIFYLTHKDAPGFKVTRSPLGGTAATATAMMPTAPDMFLDTLGGDRDAIYVAGRERLAGRVWRIPKAGGAPEPLTLPQAATVSGIEAESDHVGAIVQLDGYTTPSSTYAYTPGKGFASLGLETRPAGLDLARYTVREMDAVARDGAKVPLVIVSGAGPRRPQPFLIDAYGAYGATTLPFFTPRMLVGVDAGLGYASCSVRGGGELGEAWRLGGKGATKPNTWRDAIACAETLIKEGYTTPQMLAITGTSAGGIMVGRAATERPDLFAAAISRVGVSNTLRAETMASGPANVNEYGTVKTEAGFRDLLAMDAYQSVKDGAKLPPFLLTTGLEDPRVVPWQPAKMAARLQESGNVAMLRIDEQAGHGMGSTRSARDREEADILAFILWKAGVPDWQPRR